MEPEPSDPSPDSSDAAPSDGAALVSERCVQVNGAGPSFTVTVA
ncbi:hypothetical protein FHW23_002773 [Curtobacterium pusillum]|uniref:Uncharacterized protein n=1 Tax=Curtobacterium pusillum TaxID=69373 RepID=A0AAW3T9R9_9MICO|nr:hypothetical protein [Curtobacterium pusillum]MBA8991504.1 hypothetical protein [Curtobacterium pusillum]